MAGYDLCTGWGTPSVNLINALANASTVTVTVPTGGLSVSPQDIWVISGFAGGPFNPTSAAFQVTNTSSAAAKWSLVSTSSWLHATSTSGTLAAILLDECRREPHGGGEHVEAGNLLNFPDL